MNSDNPYESPKGAETLLTIRGRSSESSLNESQPIDPDLRKRIRRLKRSTGIGTLIVILLMLFFSSLFVYLSLPWVWSSKTRQFNPETLGLMGFNGLLFVWSLCFVGIGLATYRKSLSSFRWVRRGHLISILLEFLAFGMLFAIELHSIARYREYDLQLIIKAVLETPNGLARPFSMIAIGALFHGLLYRETRTLESLFSERTKI